MDSILTSIKKLLGITAEQTTFDPDIIMHINSVFFDLRQMGVGPTEAFVIHDEFAKWGDFIGESKDYEAIKTYVYLKLKPIFDPSSNSVVAAAIEDQTKEYEYRVYTEATLKRLEASE